MTRVLVTGASGFVGQALVTRLRSEPGVDVFAGVRRAHDQRSVQLGNLEELQFSMKLLSGFDVIVHAAARAHVLRDCAKNSLSEFRLVNTYATLALAELAAQAGVRRFLFISTVKVNGPVTFSGAPFGANDQPSPKDDYAISKYEAEQGLLELAQRTGMEVVIVRPPLVYGPGVGANFKSMLRWLNIGIPLPLGGIENRRSLLAVDNLVDLLVCCMNHPLAAGQVFLASDGNDLSTTELLRILGEALGRPAMLWPWTGPLLKLLLTLLRQEALLQRLFGSLQVDISKTRDVLGWNPPVSTRAALTQAAEDYQRQLKS